MFTEGFSTCGKLFRDSFPNTNNDLDKIEKLFVAPVRNQSSNPIKISEQNYD